MGLTLVDAGVLAGFLDADDAHHRAAGRELQRAQQRGDRMAIPASAFADALVSPSRVGDPAVQSVREFVDRLPLAIALLDADTVAVAARLRARHGQKLRLPDALVVATAIQSGVDVLVTTDRGWPTKSGLGFRGNLIRI